jgi:hypothetical protein
MDSGRIRWAAVLFLSSALSASAWGQQPAPAANAAGGPPPMGGFSATVTFTPGVYVKDGVYLKDKSVTETVSGGKVDNTAAADVSITSKADNFNGIYVKGKKSVYTISNAVIDLHGNGSNDFTGLAAGAMADDGATVILKNVKITTSGLVSPATVTASHSTLRVYDSTFKINGGTLPKGYVAKIGPGMLEAPAPLGIKGTARGALTMLNSKSYYYNTSIIAEGWGALSTDMADGDVYVEADNCDLQTIKSGYGTYSDGNTKVVVNDSKIRSATYASIIAGSGKLYLSNTDAGAAVNGVMIHNVSLDAAEIGVLDIVGGKLVSSEPVVLVKSANTDISMTGTEIGSQKGVLLQSIVNPDDHAPKVKGAVTGVRAKFKDMTMQGNILHTDPSRTMTLTFVDSTIKGAIHGAEVSLDADSKWTATENSNVTLAAGTEVARIDAPAGVTIAATAGKGSTLKGSYKLASGGVLDVKAK